MPPKRIKPGSERGYLGITKYKRKKPPDFIDETLAYRMARDFTQYPDYDWINQPLTEAYYSRHDPMEQYKGATTSKIVTVEQEAEKKARKHEEIDLQAKFCNHVRSNYQQVKFLRHEREKQRGHFSQNQMQLLNSAGSMPDWETTHVTTHHTGLLIEFKKPGEDWLLKDGITIKPQYADQYHCHVGLWKQRRVVYFCNNFDIACMIIKQYVEGRIMRQRVYKYPPQFEHLEGIT